MSGEDTRTSDDTHEGDEVDFLLRSLDDLDAEHDAGDLDDDDYQLLRDGYTARAAEVLRAREEHRPSEPVEDSGRSLRTTAVWIVGVLLVAGIAGSRSSGYPRAAVANGEVVFAWTESADGGALQVRTAVSKHP